MKEPSEKEETALSFLLWTIETRFSLQLKKKKKIGYSKLVLRKQDFGQ